MGRTAGGNAAERTLLGMSLFALAALAAGLIATAPAAASAPAGEAIGGADKLHGLDMMLIATSAHCDVSGQGFASDYQRFAERHAAEISAADAELMAAFVNAHGPAGGAALFERSSTAIANRYGQGHPWLSCGDLKLDTSKNRLISA
jgi:phosphate-selective porin